MNGLITFFQGILEVSLFASAMIVVVLLIRKIAKDRINIKVVSFLWLLVIARLCLPGMLESPAHIDALFPASVEMRQTAEQPVSQNDATSFYENNTANHTLTDSKAASSSADSSHNHSAAGEPQTVAFYEQALAFVKSLDLWLVATIAWLIGGTIVLASVLKESITFGLRIRRSSQPLDDAEILGIVAAHRRVNRLRRNIRVSACSTIQMPLAFGVWHPHILLPARMTEELGREHLEAILLHEVCHIKRNDILKSYVYVLAKALHWFNPLVWLSLRMIRKDMEFACDQRVLSLMKTGQEAKYCESLLMATRFMKQRSIPALVTSLCESKSNLKERILKMVAPQKKSRSTVVVSLALAMMMLVVCFTTACQPTPESEAVIGKNDDTLESAIHTEALPGTTIEYDERWTEELQSADKEVKILVDAPVEVPNVTNASVVSVKPHYFNDEEIVKAVEALYGNQQLYQYTVDKSELERYIISLRADIESLKRDGTYSELHMGSGAGEKADDVEGTIEFYEEKLEKVEQEYNDTPDTAEKINEIKLTRSEETGALGFYAQDGQDIPATFNAYSNSESNISLIEYRNWHGNVYSDTGELQAEKSLTLDITVVEAQQTAIDFMRSLGMEDVSVLSVHWGTAGAEKDCYMITLERMIGGIPCHTITEHTGTMAFGVDGAEYREPWNPEEIEFMIDDTGIIGFKWENPPEIGETINSNVALLSYDEIKGIASAQLPRLFTEEDLIGRGYRDLLEVSINRVTLGMMRVAKKDSTSEYYYLPVWDFLGDYGSSDSTKISLLTLNAIDGSVIDRGLGY